MFNNNVILFRYLKRFYLFFFYSVKDIIRTRLCGIKMRGLPELHNGLFLPWMQNVREPLTELGHSIPLTTAWIVTVA